MDEREGKRRGLISSMLDLFGEEPPDAPRPGYGFAPGAEPPEADDTLVDPAVAGSPAPEVRTDQPDAFRPVTPEEIGTIEPPQLTVVRAADEAPAPAAATEPEASGPAPVDATMAPLRAALSNLLSTPSAPLSPEAAAFVAQAANGNGDAPTSHQEPVSFSPRSSEAAAAAEVAAIAAQAARATAAPPPAPAPAVHVDPAAISARVNEMLASTERLTRDLTVQAEAEAGEIVEHARRQAEQQLARAREEATGIVATARSEAAGIATAAERAAEDTRRTAEEEAEHIRAYARRNASTLVQAAQANRAQVEKSLEQVMSESEFLSKEFVRALGNLVAGMRPAIEPIESDMDPAGGTEPGAVA